MDIRRTYALVRLSIQPGLKGIVRLTVLPQPFGASIHVKLFIRSDAVLGAGFTMLFDPDGRLPVHAVHPAHSPPVPPEALLLV